MVYTKHKSNPTSEYSIALYARICADDCTDADQLAFWENSAVYWHRRMDWLSASPVTKYRSQAKIDADIKSSMDHYSEAIKKTIQYRRLVWNTAT